MMAFTTDTAAAQLRNARMPRKRRPMDTRIGEASARSFERAETRRHQVRRMVALPMAVR